MKYTRKQIIITTVFDDNIEDEDVILDLVKTFHKSSIDLQVEFRDQKSKQTKSLEKARIKDLNLEDKKVDFLVMKKSFNFVEKNILISDIISIKVVTEKHNIIAGEEKLSEFDLIDVDDS